MYMYTCKHSRGFYSSSNHLKWEKRGLTRAVMFLCHVVKISICHTEGLLAGIKGCFIWSSHLKSFRVAFLIIRNTLIRYKCSTYTHTQCTVIGRCWLTCNTANVLKSGIIIYVNCSVSCLDVMNDDITSKYVMFRKKSVMLCVMWAFPCYSLCRWTCVFMKNKGHITAQRKHVCHCATKQDCFTRAPTAGITMEGDRKWSEKRVNRESATVVSLLMCSPLPDRLGMVQNWHSVYWMSK